MAKARTAACTDDLFFIRYHGIIFKRSAPRLYSNKIMLSLNYGQMNEMNLLFYYYFCLILQILQDKTKGERAIVIYGVTLTSSFM